jgi:hypothetical protein
VEKFRGFAPELRFILPFSLRIVIVSLRVTLLGIRALHGKKRRHGFRVSRGDVKDKDK